MNGFFVTGTDTGVGKTRITAGLLRAFLESGIKALAIKPVQTGCAERDGVLLAEDLEEYARLGGSFYDGGYPDACCRKYVPACSPHLAARQAEDVLDADRLTDEIRHIGQGYELSLVEGAGGVTVPLSDDQTMIDLMQRLDLPVIIVADNKLGMINHTLMSVDAVRNAGMTVAGVVINNTRPATGDDSALRKDNIRTVQQHGSVRILGEIPYLGDTPDGDAILVDRLKDATEILATENAPQSLNTDFDRDHLWHPYTSALRPLPTVKVKQARGTKIVLEDNTELVDGMASWWCAVHGYNHPELNRAARKQIGRMPHVMFGGLTHAPAMELGRTLLDMAPDSMEHVFLADSGSVSVEVALKMALQHMQASGQTRRTRLFTVRGGYHGDTCGCMSVCDPDNGMHHLFTDLLPKQLFGPRPDCAFHAQFDPASLDETRRIVKEHAEEIAAIIVEPIVQGAGGMHFYHPDYLRGLREIADEHGMLLILDEIATGFGRTGKFFACEWADIQPDIMCVGKALSGGTMTLAATLASAHVAKTVSSDGGVLMHGPTFMGNPLACAVAKASLDLLAHSDWQRQVSSIQSWLTEGLAPCRELDGVADVRVLGAIGVVEMEKPVNVPRLQDYFISRGVWLRPFGRLVYIMPPYILSREEASRLCSAMVGGIADGHHI